MAARSQDAEQQQQQPPVAAAEEEKEEEEEEEFRRLLREIGGKERIHLVSDACGVEDGARGRVLEEFVRDVFLRAPPDSCPQRTRGANGITSSRCVRAARAIDCALVVFVLTREFLARDRGGVRAKEILKDVRDRLGKGRGSPALLGLVYRAETPGEPCPCLPTLERLLRSVFTHHPPEAIWVGHFTPGAPHAVQTIKRNLCRTVRASLSEGSTVDKGSPFLRILKCLPWSRSRRYRERPSLYRQPGGAESAEEDIPLQKTSATDGEHKRCSSGAQDVQDGHLCQPV